MDKKEAGKLGYQKSKEKLKAFSKQRKIASYQKWEIENKHCPECNKRLSYEDRIKTFCDRTCATTFNNKQRDKTSHKCAGCDTLTKNLKFCSNRCQRVYERNTIHLPNFYSGKTTSPNTLRKLLEVTRFKNGTYCETCMNKEWMGQPIPLEIHHINGNSEDNLPGNLSLICPNCHALTDTYKNKNKGKGRHKRRKRYHNGKSY